MNVADYFSRHANERPSFPVLELGVDSFSYGQLRDLSERMAARLLNLGYQPGDIIGVRLADSHGYCALVWALALSGCVFFPIKTNTTKSELKKVTAGIPLKAVVINDKSHTVPRFGTIMLRDLLVPLEPSENEINWPQISPSAPFKMCQTSGSTGKPKTFVFSHSQIVDLCRQYELSWSQQDRLFFEHRMSDSWGSEILIAAMFCGVTIVLSRTLPIRAAIELMRRKKITLTGMVPYRIREFLENGSDELNQLPDMKFLDASSSVLHPEERKLFHQRFTPNVNDCYGTTEVPFISESQPNDLDSHPGSVGLPYPGVEVEIVDDNHQPVPVGVIGLLRVRSDNILTEYYKNAEASLRCFRDGWFYPLDYAYVDNDGYIYLQGRSDNVINAGGSKLYPVEIQNALMTHPRIREAIVFGWPHKKWGEMVVAVISTRSPVKPENIRAYCYKRLAPQMVPDYILPVKLIPKTAAGKVKLTSIKKMAKVRLDKLTESSPS